MVVAVSQCSSCGSPTLEDDSYCQECGKFIGVAATAADSRPLRPAPIAVEQRTDQFLTNLSPHTAKPVVSLPVVAGIVAGLLLIPCGIFAIDRSYQSISTGYIREQAKKAIDDGNPAAAIQSMDRVALAHHGLTNDERNILDLALYKEADQLIAAGNYSRARDDLQRISGSFTQTAEVGEKLERCSTLLAQQSVNVAKASRTSDSRNNRHAAKQGGTGLNERVHHAIAIADSAVSRISRTVPNPSPEKTDSKQTEIGAGTAAGAPTPSASSSESNKGTSPAKEKIATASSNVTVPSEQTAGDTAATPVKSKNKKTATGDFSHSDVARYNALLAGYFSSRSGGNGELREPLSLREWLEKGKPKF